MNNWDAHIKAIVDAAPPLTDIQRETVTALLRTGRTPTINRSTARAYADTASPHRMAA